MRLALHLLKQEQEDVDRLADSLVRLRRDVHRCRVCRNLCDGEVCDICANARREHEMICVVENFQDVVAVEATGQFRGVYHVLGGVIAPLEGIGPSDIEVESLVQRVAAGGVKEVILALSATMEGDTTGFYLLRRMREVGGEGLLVTQLARGLSVNDELQYADEATLGRSILERREM